MKKLIALTLGVLGFSYQSTAQSPACVGSPGKLKEHTIVYQDVQGFLKDLNLVRKTFGLPTAENATTMNVPRTDSETWNLLGYGQDHDSEEFKPSECQDELEYYLVLWKPENSNCATAAVDFMFSIKGFKKSFSNAEVCNGRAGNWRQSFEVPSTRALPREILERL
jgi:hypothetical protein